MTIADRLRLLALPLFVAVAAATGAESSPPGETPASLSDVDPSVTRGEDYDPLFDDDYEEGVNVGVPDPMEETNRTIFGANRQADRFFFDPITRGYRLVVPEPARKGIRNVFSNLNSPTTFANDMLQLEWEDAGVTLARMVVNTTIGLAGLFDVADSIGLEKHNSDFGQTLALAGVPSGPFMMVPFFGPTTVRDGFGTAVDIGMSPTTHILGPVVLVYYGSGMGLALRDEHFDKMKALEASSLDHYSTLRSAWWQNRESELWDRREDRRVDADYGP